MPFWRQFLALLTSAVFAGSDALTWFGTGGLPGNCPRSIYMIFRLGRFVLFSAAHGAGAGPGAASGAVLRPVIDPGREFMGYHIQHFPLFVIAIFAGSDAFPWFGTGRRPGDLPGGEGVISGLEYLHLLMAAAGAFPIPLTFCAAIRPRLVFPDTIMMRYQGKCL